MRDIARPNQFILILAALCAAGYLIIPLNEGSVAFILLKASGCILLGLAAFRSMPISKIQKLLVMALLISSLGDIFLAIRSSDYFIQGLGSFLIAHLLYVAIFIRAKRHQPLPVFKGALIGLILIFALLMMWKLWPSLEELKAPVYLYITVISLMAIAAIYSQFNGIFVISGAISFLVSDATIALDKFVDPFDLAGPVIWITYFAAQLLLTLGIIIGTNTKNAGT